MDGEARNLWKSLPQPEPRCLPFPSSAQHSLLPQAIGFKNAPSSLVGLLHLNGLRSHVGFLTLPLNSGHARLWDAVLDQVFTLTAPLSEQVSESQTSRGLLDMPYRRISRPLALVHFDHQNLNVVEAFALVLMRDSVCFRTVGGGGHERACVAAFPIQVIMEMQHETDLISLDDTVSTRAHAIAGMFVMDYTVQ